MAKDLVCLREQIRMAETYFGVDNVMYPTNYEWIFIKDFKLPPNYNYSHTNILVIVPNRIGYGSGWEEAYLDPELKMWKNGKYIYPPHYSAPKNGYHNKWAARGWRYICIRSASKNLIIFLRQLEVLLNDPMAVPEML